MSLFKHSISRATQRSRNTAFRIHAQCPCYLDMRRQMYRAYSTAIDTLKVVLSTAVRPVLLYGAETRAVKKSQEKKLEVTEMRVLCAELEGGTRKQSNKSDDARKWRKYQRRLWKGGWDGMGKR